MDGLNNSFKKPKFLAIFSMLTVVFWIACLVSQNRFVALPIEYICAAAIPYPFLCLAFDMIAEIYGYKEARKTLWLSFICVWLFALIVYAFAKLSPPSGLLTSATSFFNGEMKPLLRIFAFNGISFIFGQYVNIYLFSKMKQYFAGRYFGIRSIISTLVGDSLAFAIALYGDFSGLIKSHNIFLLVLYELAFVYLFAIALAVPASLIVRILKKIEPEFNTGVSFNPFK